jgi:hypothetical protein
LLGVGEMAGGDLSGAIHLVPAGLIVSLWLLAGRRSALCGLCLVIVGLLAAAFYYLAIHEPARRLAGAAIGGGPFLLAGLLLLVAMGIAGPARPRGSKCG